MKYYLKVLRNYANFSGRARRKEYWYFVLFSFIFGAVAVMLDNLLGIAIEGDIRGPIYGLYVLATLIPGLAVTVRRLHDVGKSGWFIFILLILLIGLFFLPVLIAVLIVVIWFLVLMLTDSEAGENAYGEKPKEVAI